MSDDATRSLAERVAASPEADAGGRRRSPKSRRRSDFKTDWPCSGRGPTQLAPEGAWRVWLMLAGRGFGKTRSGAEWVRARVEQGRVKRRVALVAPTAADARERHGRGRERHSRHRASIVSGRASSRRGGA